MFYCSGAHWYRAVTWGIKKSLMPLCGCHWWRVSSLPSWTRYAGRFGERTWRSVKLKIWGWLFPASEPCTLPSQVLVPHLQSQPLPRCGTTPDIPSSTLICCPQDGSLVPSWQQGLGLVSASWTSHSAPSLKTEHLCVSACVCPQASPPLMPCFPPPRGPSQDPAPRCWGLMSTDRSSWFLLFWMPDSCPTDLLFGHPSSGLFTMAMFAGMGSCQFLNPLNTVLCSLAGTSSISNPSLVSFPYLATPVNVWVIPSAAPSLGSTQW